jgi:hypothetical protein
LGERRGSTGGGFWFVLFWSVGVGVQFELLVMLEFLLVLVLMDDLL